MFNKKRRSVSATYIDMSLLDIVYRTMIAKVKRKSNIDCKVFTFFCMESYSTLNRTWKEKGITVENTAVDTRRGEVREGQTETAALTHRRCCWAASVGSDSVRPHRRQPAGLPSLGFSRREHYHVSNRQPVGNCGSKKNLVIGCVLREDLGWSGGWGGDSGGGGCVYTCSWFMMLTAETDNVAKLLQSNKNR